MGTSQRPPPPSAQPPIDSKAKDYSMDRPSEVQNELDDLRNRGLAKVLNRHFTDTTKKLAKEKAAADAALADLERRRAHTSEFVPSKGGELNPFDSLYVQLQQKRAECRRKERETLLLYQRYVHKYGNKAKPVELSPATSTASTPEAPPPPSPLPLPARTILQPLDENIEGVDPDVNFAKFYNKRIQEAKDPPTKALDDESTEVPDLQDLTPQPSRESGATDPPEHSEDVHNEEQKDDHCVIKQEEARRSTKADPPTDPPATEFAKQAATPKAQELETLTVDSQKSCGWGKVLFTKEEECATAEESSTRVETTIKATVERLEIGSSSSDSASNRPTREVTTELSTLVPEDEEEDDRSIISGLTMNSQVTRQVMEEIEQEMTRFLNTETEAIRQLLDEEEEETTESNTLNGSVVGDESRRASMQAEAMAREMQKILDEYAKEDMSESPLATEESEVDTDTVATSGYPRKYETSDPTKEWMVYYDESFKREYYYEVHTKAAQWEPPCGGSSTMPLMSEEVAPISFMRTTSRRDLYRKKIRKRRVRRFVTFSFLVLVGGGTLYNWQQNHSDKTYPEAMMASWLSTSDFVVDLLDTSYQALIDGVNSLHEQFDHTFTNSQADEETTQLLAMEESRKAEQLEVEKARAEAEQQTKEDEAKSIKDEQREVEEESLSTACDDQDMTTTEKETQERNIEESNTASERVIEDAKTLQRPLLCFLPLSYLHPRCNDFAKLKPLYKDTDVLNSFLQ